MAQGELQNRTEVRMILAALLLAACAELPKCPEVTAFPMQYLGKQWYIFDAENLQALWTRAGQRAKGECE